MQQGDHVQHTFLYPSNISHNKGPCPSSEKSLTRWERFDEIADSEKFFYLIVSSHSARALSWQRTTHCKQSLKSRFSLCWHGAAWWSILWSCPWICGHISWMLGWKEGRSCKPITTWWLNTLAESPDGRRFKGASTMSQGRQEKTLSPRSPWPVLTNAAAARWSATTPKPPGGHRWWGMPST